MLFVACGKVVRVILRGGRAEDDDPEDTGDGGQLGSVTLGDADISEMLVVRLGTVSDTEIILADVMEFSDLCLFSAERELPSSVAELFDDSIIGIDSSMTRLNFIGPVNSRCCSSGVRSPCFRFCGAFGDVTRGDTMVVDKRRTAIGLAVNGGVIGYLTVEFDTDESVAGTFSVPSHDSGSLFSSRTMTSG